MPKKYLLLYKTDSAGLVVHREGGWMWHDWGSKVDVQVLDNAWYYTALDGAARMAKLLDKQTDYEQYRQTMQRLRPAFRAAFWTGSGYKSPDYKHGYDDRAQGMAVVSGLNQAGQWSAMKQILDTTFNAGPYLEKYILEAYFQMNDVEAGLTRMKNRYQIMVESPLTTLWEGWNIGDPTYVGGTYNHGWTGGPLTLLHQYIAGITVQNDSVTIMPQPASLSRFTVKSNLKNGAILTDFKTNGSKTSLTLNTPATVTGRVGLPKISGKPNREIRVNGVVATPIAETGTHAIFSLKTGLMRIQGE